MLILKTILLIIFLIVLLATIIVGVLAIMGMISTKDKYWQQKLKSEQEITKNLVVKRRLMEKQLEEGIF